VEFVSAHNWRTDVSQRCVFTDLFPARTKNNGWCVTFASVSVTDGFFSHAPAHLFLREAADLLSFSYSATAAAV